MNRQEVVQLLKTAKGQLEAVERMVDNNSYCIDICTQLLALSALVNKANKRILTDHLASCVLTATGDNLAVKLQEINKLLDKLL